MKRYDRDLQAGVLSLSLSLVCVWYSATLRAHVYRYDPNNNERKWEMVGNGRKMVACMPTRIRVLEPHTGELIYSMYVCHVTPSARARAPCLTRDASRARARARARARSLVYHTIASSSLSWSISLPVS